MTLRGDTLFAGDSITVGLAPFVKVDGQKRTAAKSGQSSAALLGMLQGPSAADLAASQNVVVLIGTNDIGSSVPVQKLAETIQSIWALARSKGARVFAMTVPPVKGYAGFPNFSAVEARRKALNALLGTAFVSGQADGLIDLSALLADPADPERLAGKYDGGDHLHPRKDALGGLLSFALSGGNPVAPPSQAPEVTGESFPWTTAFLLVGIAVGGTILLARKDSQGSSIASRALQRIS